MRHRVSSLSKSSAASAPSQQTVTEFAEHGKVEAGVGQVQTHKVLPVDPSPDRLGGLAISQMFAKLQNRHQGQAPWGQSGVAPRRKQRGKVLGLENRAQVIPQGEIRMAFGKGGMRNTSGLLGNGANGLRAQGHHGGPSVNRVEA